METNETTQSPNPEDNSPDWYEQWIAEYDYQIPKRGQILEGKVVQIDDEAMVVDVGLKRDAIVPALDLSNLDAEFVESLSIGDTVNVYVTNEPTGDQDLLVSLDKGIELANWEEAEAALEDGRIYELEVVGENRGGLLVKYKSLQGFVPNSQAPQLRGRDPKRLQEQKAKLMGATLVLKVIEVDRRQRRLVLSALAAQEERRQQRLTELEKGQVIPQAKVAKVIDFGVFVDIGGLDGLIHISELDWQNVKHPSEVVKVGDLVDVQIVDIDPERERISLSRKALMPNPWESIKEKYEPGALIEGQVSKVLDFGAFIELPEGIEGLVHVSEIGYTASTNPQDVVKTGETVLVKVLSVEPERERISLSMRQVPMEKQIAWAVDRSDDEGEVEE